MEQQYDIENEIEIDLRELLAQIFGYWKLILLVVVLSAGVAFSISKFVLVPQYESTAVLYVLSKSSGVIFPSFKNMLSPPALESAGIPLKYLLVSRPCASGEYAIAPIPFSSIVSSNPSSTQRLSIEYEG